MDQPLPGELEQVGRGRALRDQRRRCLHERPLLDERGEPLVEVDSRMTLGVCDHAAKPAVGEPLDRIEQVLPERTRSRLDQQPPAVPERDTLEHVVGKLIEHRLGHLARGDHAHVEALPLELVVDGQRPHLELVRHDRVVRVDVRRGADQLDTVALGDARHLHAVREVARPVVELGKDVAVEVDHALKYRARRGFGHSELHGPAVYG